MKQLIAAEEENISLQNILDSVYKTEILPKVENNSLTTKLFDANKTSVSLPDENQFLVNKIDGIRILEGA